MSAYVHEGNNQLIPITRAQEDPSELGLPTLPKVDRDLENYFTAARQLESALRLERANLRKVWEELKELQAKHARLSSDAENKIREMGIREERLKSQLSFQEQNERNVREQLRESSSQTEKVLAEKKKLELDSELMKARLDFLKQREKALTDNLQALQKSEDARTQLAQDLNATKNELHQYKAAWGKVVAFRDKANKAFQEVTESRKRTEELTEFLEQSKRRIDSLEEQVNREKRDKQIALTCLNSAEAKLSQVQQELELLRSHKLNGSDSALELKFL